MSAVVLNRELTYKGKKYVLAPIRRLVVKVGDDGTIPSEYIGPLGFRRDFTWGDSSTVLDAKMLMQFGEGGGLIVGEGDTGKTWFTQQMENADDHDYLHVNVIKLRECINAPQKLIDLANEFWNAHRDKSGYANLIFDGLDENPNATSSIIRICHGLPDKGKCRVWVTSRMCSSIRELLASGAIKQRYGLLPFDEEDIKALAQNVHENGDAFLDAIKQKRVAMFATKPGGATNLLSLYGDGKILTASRHDLIRGIALKFVHESRDGVEKSANELKFDDEKLLDASAWIATRMLFAQKDRIWNSAATSCPSDALFYDALLSAQNYPRELMNVATSSRLFEPLDDYTLRFTCDTTLMPFLAAHWICNHVPQETIPNLIKTKGGVGKTVATVFNWIGLLKPDVVQQWIKHYPAAFLGCHEAFEKFGVDEYYRQLESRLIDMSPSDSSQTLRDNAACLEGDTALTEMALARLVAKKMPLRKVILAAEILKFTRVNADKSIDLIVDYLAQHWDELSIENRKDFAFALENIVADDKRHHASLAKLKPLLFTLKPNSSSDDSLRGVLLILLWPRYMTETELVKALPPKASQNIYDSYSTFIEYKLPESFEENFDSDNIGVLLDWTLETGIITEYVFTYAWKWAERPDVAKKLADIIAKVSDQGAYRHFELPLADKLRKDLPTKKTNWSVSPLQCEQAKEKRFTVLDAVLHDNTWSNHDYLHMQSFGAKMGLYYNGDFADLYKWWQRIRDDSNEIIVANHLSDILESLSCQLSFDQCTEERKELLARYPSKKAFDINHLKESHDKWLKQEGEFTAEQKKRADEKSAAEVRHKESFQKHILTAEMKPDLFINLAHWLDSSTAQMTTPEFDINKTCQWDNLSDEAKTRVYQAAAEAVKAYAPEFPSMTHGMAFCSAMHLVWHDKSCSAKTLPDERWRDIVYIMTQAAFDRFDMEKCEDMVLWGYANYPDVCEEGFYKSVERELCSKECHHSILGVWSRLITDSLLARLIERFGSDAPHMVAILNVASRELFGRSARFPSVEAYLRMRFANKGIETLSNDANLMALATVFCPNDFIPFIVDCAKHDGDAVQRWLNVAMDDFHEHVMSGFHKADMKSVAQFYLWMDKVYPSEKEPQHEMVYTPQSIDNIYELKSHLANLLLTQPTKVALEVFDAALATHKKNRLADMRKRIAHTLEELSPPELGPVNALIKIAMLERPIGQMTEKEYKKIVKELNKDLATKTDLKIVIGDSLEEIKKRLQIVKEIALDGLDRLQKRSKARQRRVDAVITCYYKLTNNGTKVRDALSIATNNIEHEMGLAGLKWDSLRNAADRTIKRYYRKYGEEAPVRYREEHPLPE